MRSDSRHHGHHGHDEEDDFIEPPSKSSLKREMHALQDLGEQLVALSPERLKKVPLPDSLYEAIRAAQGFKMEARRRQMQYIGKLMRKIDPAPIQAQLDIFSGNSAAEVAKMHRLERLREQLLEDDKTLGTIAETWPEADLQYLRTLRRNALKEREAGKPPKSFREIFRVLRELQEAQDAAAEAQAGDAEGADEHDDDDSGDVRA
ncbi:Putative alpha helix protein [Thauera humireducens]|uniref:ribosome biogenesis factor YjgA n=1 Tax=Thauera humireducens TaxID=1134435 RepID=UPI002467A7BE|nr:ribosome biogenesis factor YjgA [Thauera humireducens]CAH1747574.1 Putative alpha helix protein [Thauera humireducens]